MNQVIIFITLVFVFSAIAHNNNKQNIILPHSLVGEPVTPNSKADKAVRSSGIKLKEAIDKEKYPEEIKLDLFSYIDALTSGGLNLMEQEGLIRKLKENMYKTENKLLEEFIDAVIVRDKDIHD